VNGYVTIYAACAQAAARLVGVTTRNGNLSTLSSGLGLSEEWGRALAAAGYIVIHPMKMNTARARGRKGGRPKALTPKKARMVQVLYRNKDNSIDEICKTLNISRATLYRYINTAKKTA
jgi:hypothetical protein